MRRMRRMTRGSRSIRACTSSVTQLATLGIFMSALNAHEKFTNTNAMLAVW